MKEYKINKVDLSFYLIGALIFVILGALMVTGVIGPNENGTEFDRIGGIVLGWIAIVFFGGLGLVSLRFLFQDDEAVVVIDETGFYDKRVCTKKIPWSEIRKASIFRGKTLYAFPQKFISLDVNNPEEYLKKSSNSIFSGLLKTLNALYDEPGITISTAILGCSTEAVLKVIEEESNGVVNVEY